MKRRNTASLLLIMLLAAIPVFSACGGTEKEPPEPQQVILEPGATQSGPATSAPPETPGPEEPPEEEEGFVDMGLASTLKDLMANKEKIHSYYFEYATSDEYGEMFVRTWYKDGLMKIVRSFPDGDEIFEYFIYEELALVSYAPAYDSSGTKIYFKPDDPYIPRNHLSNDYGQYSALSTESIGGQTCRVIEKRGERRGEKLWVSTLYGFPLQAELIDPGSGERRTEIYENLTLNQVEYTDVLIPGDLDIVTIQQ